ncbi:MAG: hypothetical protein ACJAWF_002176 [Candidatus Azotimanducaceae bacterium]|jgi:hypothetical protein
MALEQVNPDALRSFAGKVSGSVTKILDHIEAQPPPRKRAAAIQELGSKNWGQCNDSDPNSWYQADEYKVSLFGTTMARSLGVARSSI